ncbi:sodium-coupled neutral amino acid transporter 9 homolog [Plakobranchus ocellatus]|uniref:Sodium-coupled neutral amino acid transporter 9 homolog n=1 Tax=Plakobranchus ocellatus TaxID=259542 RepID=A0AAV4BPL1_9GAST|nr:sodium-coupled neutral amino acid transporter 9 homolog [Plakobranchus ocellatus]
MLVETPGRKIPHEVNGEESSSDEDEHSSLLHASSITWDNYGLSPNHPNLQDLESVEVELSGETLSTKSQSSIVTIFSMWNTMMGTSLLSMPWAIKQAGYVNGIVLLIVMAGIMAYTSYRVLTAGKSLAISVVAEFSDVVRIYLGRIFEVIAVLCSLLTLLGGCIVYWILMSNFLYHVGVFIQEHAESSPGNESYLGSLNGISDATCDNATALIHHQKTTFEKVWDVTHTVPLFLICLLFPIMNFKSPTFFTKFNALGTLSVAYLIVFVTVKSIKWGINLDLNPDHSSYPEYSPMFEWSFPALTGVSALAYLLQNAVMAIVRNQKHPENNTRDLVIAYICVCVTYTFMGALFYAAFPLDKSCIEDNFLNNVAADDVMAFIARIGLFFQMSCVFPLLTFIIRAQFLQFMFRSVWPSTLHVVILNVILVAVCVLFAIFMPKIGHIISFVGAFCGFSYAIALPCAVYIFACRRDGNLTFFKLAIHSFLIFIGFINFVAQFVIIGHTK